MMNLDKPNRLCAKSAAPNQLEDWQEVLDLAIKAGNTEIQEKVEKQIRKINEKLKF